jgi:hypothetical protein
MKYLSPGSTVLYSAASLVLVRNFLTQQFLTMPGRYRKLAQGGNYHITAKETSDQFMSREGENINNM